MYVEENAAFQVKVVEKSGLDMCGTYLPPAIHPSLTKEPKTDMITAMEEAEMVMGGAVSEVLEKTGTCTWAACRKYDRSPCGQVSVHCSCWCAVRYAGLTADSGATRHTQVDITTSVVV